MPGSFHPLADGTRTRRGRIGSTVGARTGTVQRQFAAASTVYGTGTLYPGTG